MGVCHKHILIHAGKGVRQGTGMPKKLCGVPHKNRPASNFTATEISLTTKITKNILLNFTLPGLSGQEAVFVNSTRSFLACLCPGAPLFQIIFGIFYDTLPLPEICGILVFRVQC